MSKTVEVRELIFDGDLEFGYYSCGSVEARAVLPDLVFANDDIDHLEVTFLGDQNILSRLSANEILGNPSDSSAEGYIDFAYGPVEANTFGHEPRYIDSSYKGNVDERLGPNNKYPDEASWPSCGIAPMYTDPNVYFLTSRRLITDNSTQHVTIYAVRLVEQDPYSKNMTFVYEKTPKFREQETGHAYFNTRKGETRELIFEGTVSFNYSGCDGQHQHAALDGLYLKGVEADYLVVDFAGKENILYKILAADVEPELREDLIDRIPYVFGPVKSTYVTYMDYSEGQYHGIYKTEDEYPLCAVVPYSPYGGSELPQILAPGDVIEGRPSVKIYAVTGVSNNEGQFSEFAKNVNVKAHTEYTSHKNGPLVEVEDYDYEVKFTIAEDSEKQPEDIYDLNGTTGSVDVSVADMRQMLPAKIRFTALNPDGSELGYIISDAKLSPWYCGPTEYNSVVLATPILNTLSPNPIGHSAPTLSGSIGYYGFSYHDEYASIIHRYGLTFNNETMTVIGDK